MKKSHKICIMLVFLASLVTVGWFKEGHLIYFWDATFPLNPTKSVMDYSYTWSESLGLGETDILRVKMIPYLFFIFTSYKAFGLLFSQAFLYLFLFSLSGISMFTLTHYLLKKDNRLENSYSLLLGSISSALFYMFNLYSLLFLWRIFSTSLFLYSVLPLILLFYVRFLEEPKFKLKRLLLVAFPFFLVSVSHLALILLLFAFLLLYLVYSIAVFKNMKEKIKKFSIMLLVVSLVNLYWLLPFAYYSANAHVDILSEPYGGTLSALNFNSRFANLLSILRLKGQQILYEQYQGEYDYPWITMYHDQNINFFTLVSFLIPLVCFFPLFFRKRYYLFFGIASLLLIFFVKGIHEPFGILYEFLFSSSSIFSTFRDPYSKFGLFYTFCLSFLFGAGIMELSLLLRRARSKVRLDFVIPVTWVILLIGPYTFPMWTGDVIPKGSDIRPSARVEIPEEYIDIAKYLENEAERSSFKVVELPFQDRPLQSCLWNYGYVGYPAIRTLTYLPTISGITGNEKANEFYRSLYNSLETDPSSIIPFLGRLGIKYIILHGDINPRFAPPTTDPNKLKTFLENSDDLNFVGQFGKLRTWELKKAYPTIYGIMNRDQSDITYFSLEGENISLEFLSSETREAFNVKIDPITKHQGNYSLKITTNMTFDWWCSWLAGSEIFVRKNELYQIISHVKADNVLQSHIVIEGFNETSMSWQQILQSPNGLDGTFEWRRFSRFFAIPQNITKIRVIFNAGCVKDATKGNATTWFDDIRITKILGDEEILTPTYHRINPTLWKVESSTQEPFILSFTEKYDSLWVGYVNGERVSSFPLYGVVNGFWINQTGQLEITIEYEPQRWFFYGSIVSVATLLACLTYLTYNWTKNKAFWKRIETILRAR
jgi:hypothetical protein